MGLAVALGSAALAAAAVAVPKKPRPPQVSSANELLVVAAGAFARHKPIPAFDIMGGTAGGYHRRVRRDLALSSGPPHLVGTFLFEGVGRSTDYPDFG